MSTFLVQEIVRIVSQGRFFLLAGSYWGGALNVFDFFLVSLPVRNMTFFPYIFLNVFDFLLVHLPVRNMSRFMSVPAKLHGVVAMTAPCSHTLR